MSAEAEVYPLTAPPRVGIERTSRSLRVELSEEELGRKAQALAAELHALDELRERHKAERAAMKEAEGLQADAVKILGVDVRTRSELRDVECEWIADFPRGLVELVRLDTDEVVAERPIEPRDRQLAIRLAGG